MAGEKRVVSRLGTGQVTDSQVGLWALGKAPWQQRKWSKIQMEMEWTNGEGIRESG
jgi:hypothetical protein